MTAGHCQLLRAKRAESDLSNSPPSLNGQLQQNSIIAADLGYFTGVQFIQVACLRLVRCFSRPVTACQSRLLVSMGSVLFCESNDIPSCFTLAHLFWY